MVWGKLMIKFPLMVLLSFGLLVSCAASKDTPVSSGHVPDDQISHAHGGQKGDMLQRRIRMAQHLKSFDTNGDGVIKVSDVPEGARKVFDIIDSNHDEELSEDELDYFASSQFRRPHRQRPDQKSYAHGGQKGDMLQRRIRMAQHLKSFDTNGDGVIKVSDIPEGARKVFDIIDSNHDEELSEDELNYFASSRFRRPHQR